MLILIGLLIVYIDIYVGNVDVVPDLIGYLLMIPGFFIERGRGRLVKVNNTRHIDGMAALLDAMTVRQKWAPEIGEQLKNKRG